MKGFELYENLEISYKLIEFDYPYFFKNNTSIYAQ